MWPHVRRCLQKKEVKKRKKRTLRKLFCQMLKPLTCFISCQISSHKECFLCLFLFPSSRLLNHSQHLNILLSSSPPTCYDKERRNVRKDAHSSQCTHRSPRGRLPRRACVCDKSERCGQHPGTTFEARRWLFKGVTIVAWGDEDVDGVITKNKTRVLGDLWSSSTSKTLSHFALTWLKSIKSNKWEKKRFSCSFLNKLKIFPT